MKQAEKVDLVKERYLPHCSFYHEHGMPEDMEKLVMSVGYQRGSITEHECFSCGKKEVYYYLPQMSESEKKRYTELVLETLDDDAKEMIPDWRIQDDLFVLYICDNCKTWFIDERWSDGH
jgi:hypothetical protein